MRSVKDFFKPKRAELAFNRVEQIPTEKFVQFPNFFNELMMLLGTLAKINAKTSDLNPSVMCASKNFVDYFEDTFIGRVIRNNRRRAPRFSVNMWNCFSRLDEELPRTNNSSEGWNQAFKNSARENPSIYESIADLRIEQHSNLNLAEQLEAAHVVRTGPKPSVNR
ncbi:unnamed protein product, partial [Rotaria magnacalcarata]